MAGRRPLDGVRVMVTRPRSQAAGLCNLLAQEGAIPVEVPAVAIEPLPDLASLDAALDRLGSYQWVVFTSANAVDVVLGRIPRMAEGADAFADLGVCAIGPGTAAALEGWGLQPAYVPERYVAEGLVDGLQAHLATGDRVLLPRAEGARGVLIDGLRSAGAMVEEVPIYRAVPPPDLAACARSALEAGVDAVTFTSSSTVRHLVAALDGRAEALDGVVVACVGPVTAATAGEAGLRVDVVASEYATPGLVAALCEHYALVGGGR